MNFCTECGNKLTGNEKFCSQCGFDLREADSSTVSKKEASESPENASKTKADAGTTVESKTAVESRVAKAKDSIKASKESSSSLQPAPGKIFVVNILAYGFLAILVLGPSAYLYKSNMHVMSSLCSLLGGILVFVFPYRKRWKLSMLTTLIPAIAIFLASYLIVALIGTEARGGTLNHVMYDYIAQAALISGPVLGIVLGALRKLEHAEGGVWTQGLLRYLLPWGLACMLTVGIASAFNAPLLVFTCFIGVLILGSSLPALFLTLLLRKFFVRGATSLAIAATLFLLCGGTLSVHESYAQSFSEADKQVFKDSMMPFRKEVAQKLHDQGYWVRWNVSGGLNRNNYDFRTPSALKALLTLELGTKNGKAEQSGESIPIRLMKFSNQMALTAELKKQQEKSMQDAKRDTINSNFEVRAIDAASGIEVFSFDRVLPGIRHMKQETKKFQLFLRTGEWLVIFPVRKAYERRRTGYMDALYAIRGSLDVAGSTSSTTLIPVERPSLPQAGGLSSDIVSGRSTGASSSTAANGSQSRDLAIGSGSIHSQSQENVQTRMLDESTLNPEWHGKMGWMDTGFIREHKGSETSGVVAMVLLASSLLMGIGASWSVTSGKGKS